MQDRTYILCIKVNKDAGILVGKRGNINFRKGLYLYVGSAKRNFTSRLNRHLSKDKKIFWHIDNLLSSENVEISQIWKGDRAECRLAKIFLKKGLSNIEKFGSSDCKCPSHLFFVEDISRISQLLKKEGFIKWRRKSS